MPAPKRPQRGRRKPKKNIPIGQAHIKTSFNNTIVSLTDREGNVIAWESAGGAGFKGSRKSTPFAAQVTADAAARKGIEQGLQKVEVFVKGPGSGRETAIRSLQAAGLEVTACATSPRRPTTAAAPASGGASRTASWHETHPTVQAVPPRGPEALPQGRALPDRQVRRRAPRVPAGRPRPRPPEAERVPRAAAREAEGPPLLRRPRGPVPPLLRQGEPAGRASQARTCCAARVPLRQRARAARLRRLAPPGPPADPPRPLDDQRPPRRHPQLPGARGRRHRRQGQRARPSR